MCFTITRNTGVSVIWKNNEEQWFKIQSKTCSSDWRSHGAKGGSGSRARDGRSLRREQLIQQWEQLIRRWEQLIWEKVVGLSEKSYHFLKSRTTFWREQLIWGKFSREFCAYTANSSLATAVSWLGQANTRRYQSVFGAYIMFVRGGASLASTFRKITFTFTSGAGNAVYKGFPPTITPVSTFIYPSPNLHPRMTGEAPEPHRTWRVKDRWRFCIPFAPAGNACEPLFTGTFSLRGEGEG